jgi:hypothetical protein
MRSELAAHGAAEINGYADAGLVIHKEFSALRRVGIGIAWIVFLSIYDVVLRLLWSAFSSRSRGLRGIVVGQMAAREVASSKFNEPRSRSGGKQT